MWQSALWGALGAVTNLGIAFLEASQRVKGWPWRLPLGPGGGVYLVSVLVHLGIAAATTAALANTDLVANAFVAFGAGAAAPAIVKRVSRYAESAIPAGPDEPTNEQAGTP